MFSPTSSFIPLFSYTGTDSEELTTIIVRRLLSSLLSSGGGGCITNELNSEVYCQSLANSSCPQGAYHGHYNYSNVTSVIREQREVSVLCRSSTYHPTLVHIIGTSTIGRRNSVMSGHGFALSSRTTGVIGHVTHRRYVSAHCVSTCRAPS